MFRLPEKTFRYIYFSAAFLLLFTVPVQAYIDPSVMTYAIQALAGIAIALGTFFGLYWRKIRKPVLRFFNLDETAGKEEESDELVYFDPSVMKEERKIIVQKDLNAKDGVKTKGKIRTILEDMIPALFITLSGCFMICIYAPLDLYFNNKNEFWFNAQILLPQLIRMMCMIAPAVLAVYMICRLIHRKLYSALLFVTTLMLVCSYIQGNFRIANLPSMDGTPADWSIYGKEDLITVLIWIIVAGLMLLVYRYVKEKGFRAVAEMISCLLTLILSVSLVMSYLGSRKTVEKNVFVSTKDHEFEVSDTENFFILILDAVDADRYAEVYESHPEYREKFDDFTFFQNTNSLYPFTSRAIPHILTGDIYTNQEDFTEFVTRTMDECRFFRTLEERQYRMGIYEPELSYNGTQLKRFENMRTDNVELNPEAKNTFIKEQFKLTLFKYLPYCFKKYVPCNTNSFISMIWPQPFLMDNRDFYDDLANVPAEKTSDKVFRFYHIDGAHTPFRYDKDVNYVGENESTYFQSVEASMTIAGRFVDKLKEAGVYDNSVILIMADHGYSDDVGGVMDRFNPLLMVKGFHEDHPYAVSQAPLSYVDLAEAYQRLLDHRVSEECFDAREGDERSRRLLWFEWQSEDYMVEYYQDGYAADYQNIKPAGKEYRR
jgi:hypothetical protein